MAKKLNDYEFIIGPVRAGYLNVFKPRMNAKKKQLQFEITALWPKGVKATPTGRAVGFEADKAMFEEYLKAALIKKFDKVPPKYFNPLLDGDVETNDDGELKHPGFYYLGLTEREEDPPLLIDARGKPITNPNDWGSGDWVNIKLSVSAWDYDGKKGVSAYVKAVQFLETDERFGKGRQTLEKVQNDFDCAADEEEFLK